mgnify:CR=1 FL=1
MRSAIIATCDGFGARARMSLLAACSELGCSAIILPPHIQPKPVEEVVKEIKLSWPDPVYEVPFMPRETAYERSHPNQPFYAPFTKRRRHTR